VIWRPRDYQRRAATFFAARKRVGLFLDPGLGKTTITLAALEGLRLLGRFRRGLVVAPLRVASLVWPKEIEQWEQFRHLRISVVHGTAKERRAALAADADLYAINPEGLLWLYKEVSAGSLRLPEGLGSLVVDESTRFKTHSAKCWKALKALLPLFERRVILTGTPCTNSLEDLYTQIFILDEGKRLGKNVSAFRARWFYRGGFQGREWLPIPGAKEQIEAAIADLVLRLDARELLDLPELVVNDVEVELPPSVRAAYRKLERSLLLELDGADVTAFSSGAKYNFCRQVANGGIYVDQELDGAVLRRAETVHSAKVDALDSLVSELGGKPALVCYQFKHDLERLRAWRSAPALSGGISAKEAADLVERWNRGELPLLYCQPRAMSHGLNLQKGGSDLIWFGLTDDLDAYLQTNARLYRQGQTGKSVRIHRLIARGTVDQAIKKRLEAKDARQSSILDALREYARERGDQ
jgi:SNF2 family DNA or RNA helicase